MKSLLCCSPLGHNLFLEMCIDVLYVKKLAVVILRGNEPIVVTIIANKNFSSAANTTNRASKLCY